MGKIEMTVRNQTTCLGTTKLSQALKEVELETGILNGSSYSKNWTKPIWHETLELFILICFWYFSSSFSNNLNKTILYPQFLPFPLTLTLYQFLALVLGCAFMFNWGGKNYTFQKLTMNDFRTVVFPLCLSSIFAHLFTQISIAHVPVSFTHHQVNFTNLCSFCFLVLRSPWNLYFTPSLLYYPNHRWSRSILLDWS